jgi:hypothetical protein
VALHIRRLKSHVAMKFERTDGHKKEFVVGTLSALIALCLNPLPSLAQIPMMEDFYQTSGTKVIQNVKESKPESPIAGKDIRETIILSAQEAKGIKDTVKMQNWEDLIKIRKRFKVVRSQYFGLTSLKSLVQELGVSARIAQDIESAREDLSFSLEELNEFALRHRIVVFNTEDLKLIALTGDGSGTLVTADDAKELDGLANSVLESFASIAAKL